MGQQKFYFTCLTCLLTSGTVVISDSGERFVKPPANLPPPPRFKLFDFLDDNSTSTSSDSQPSVDKSDVATTTEDWLFGDFDKSGSSLAPVYENPRGVIIDNNDEGAEKEPEKFLNESDNINGDPFTATAVQASNEGIQTATTTEPEKSDFLNAIFRSILRNSTQPTFDDSTPDVPIPPLQQSTESVENVVNSVDPDPLPTDRAPTSSETDLPFLTENRPDEKKIWIISADDSSNADSATMIPPPPFPNSKSDEISDQRKNDSLISLMSVLFPIRLEDKQLENKGATSAPAAPSAGTVDPVFCKAKCIQNCMSEGDNGFFECETVCTAASSDDLCTDSDANCLKMCGLNPINTSLKSVNITSLKYYKTNEVLDPETVEVSWDTLSDASLYIVEFIPNSKSAESGSFITKTDVTNVPWYSFRKDDLCYEYYARVAAVFPAGVGPFSEPKFLKSAFKTNPMNMKIDVKEITTQTVFDSEDMFTISNTLAQIDLDIFSLQYFDLSKIYISSYLLADQCKNLKAGDVIGTKIADGRYKIDVAQFAFIDQHISIRLPIHYATFDCSYQFRIASLRTRCGDVISYISGTGEYYDSPVGTNFYLNCKNVQYENCQSSSEEDDVITTDSDSSTVGTSTVQQEPNCDVTGFTADVIGNIVDKFNVTVLWDSLTDSTQKTYLVRHGSSHRRLIMPSEDDLQFEPEKDIKIFDDGTSQTKQKSVKLNRPFEPNELHIFQICAIYNDDSLYSIDWSMVPKHIVDLAAFPTPLSYPSPINQQKLADQKSPDDKVTQTPVSSPSTTEQSMSYSDMLFDRNLDVSWFMVATSFFAIFAFLVVFFLILSQFKKCRRPKVKMTKPQIFVHRVSSMKKPILTDAVEPNRDEK